MEIGSTLYVSDRRDWRSWLAKHHASEKEIWLIYYKKHTDKPRIPYNDAVEEALCYGWIDSIVKKIDEERFAQRFTPRNHRSRWSEANKERVHRLIALGKMTPAGLAKAAVFLNSSGTESKPAISSRLVFAPDILGALKQDDKTWRNFSQFPESYKRIRIGWIEMGRPRPSVFEQRLRYFLKMTAQNKRYGLVQ
jgi:uncharacterized protein YdeI (YjbR/CyaY-like superfamily)